MGDRDERHFRLPERHRPESVPDMVWAPLAAGLLLLIVGAFALAVNKALLFPSLGPTAYLQAESPKDPSSRFYNVVVGHLSGLGAGFFAVTTLGPILPSALANRTTIDSAHVAASVLALALTILIGLLLHASHAPAAATTLLVALGVISTREDALHLIIGVFIVATIGEAVRRFRIGDL